MRLIPTAIAIAVGLVTLLDYFYTQPLLDEIGKAFKQWTIILTAFALLLGLINLLQVHLTRIVRRHEASAGYSVIVVIVAAFVFVVGLLFMLPSAPMTWIFDNVYAPLQGAFFALVAFFLATAAYRALRARNLETTWMLIAALVVFAGQTPILGVLADAREWVLNIPSTAGVRGILIGVALGTIATALRLLVGLDRPYSE
jgi:cytochrome bd-type quinol oxidase subunit 2